MEKILKTVLSFLSFFLLLSNVLVEASLEKYCAHHDSAKVRKCVVDQGREMVSDIACRCAAKLKPDLFLHDDEKRRDYFCEEASPEERDQYENCFIEDLRALNDPEVFKILDECLDAY
ncbi:uncharacterized protein LOC111629133 [Centruroides sculpturatus]|uniref:uncharacterized protein LOC111629133 n=1 Tax=Centruroides sculpturatus TaxID=218467 RepID=UPI000C6D0743|nr:uncharacterized protein LOC111629133 [Centruroides sculpturatus]